MGFSYQNNTGLNFSSMTSFKFSHSKGLNTLCVVSLAFFYFFLTFCFSRVFTRDFSTKMLVSKMQMKTQEQHCNPSLLSLNDKFQ